MGSGYPEQFSLADYFLDHNLREGRGDKVAVKKSFWKIRTP